LRRYGSRIRSTSTGGGSLINVLLLLKKSAAAETLRNNAVDLERTGVVSPSNSPPSDFRPSSLDSEKVERDVINTGSSNTSDRVYVSSQNCVGCCCEELSNHVYMMCHRPSRQQRWNIQWQPNTLSLRNDAQGLGLQADTRSQFPFRRFRKETPQADIISTMMLCLVPTMVMMVQVFVNASLVDVDEKSTAQPLSALRI